MALSAQSVAHSSWQLPPALAPPPTRSIVSTLPRSNESPSSASTDSRTVHPPLSNDGTASNTPEPPPFVLAELNCHPNPLSSQLTCQLCAQVAAMVRTLPDDGLDSQTQVLHCIIESIRADGAKSSYYFNDKSVEELRTILRRDDAFSAAMRTVFGRDFVAAAHSMLLIIRHVCRRPRSNQLRKRVQFAEETPPIDADNAPEDLDSGSASCPDNSRRVFPPFVHADLRCLPNPFAGSVMTHLTLLAHQHVQKFEGEPDCEVRLAQFLLDSMHKLGLVPTPSVPGIDESTLRDCVQRDAAFSESLRALHTETIYTFVDRFFPIVRYIWYSLLH
ncbi:hypothetical protein AURDEDRAFT_186716 [Auricularia subglabra TFB-10046 SS5]|nr:hypothetical protein AURDEDRAFT_186716 [Auricularia subglabra TFB-10046 SS5]